MGENSESDEAIFISKVKTSGSSLNVTIPVDTCSFCNISDGDLIELKIIKLKKKKGK